MNWMRALLSLVLIAAVAVAEPDDVVATVHGSPILAKQAAVPVEVAAQMLEKDLPAEERQRAISDMEATRMVILIMEALWTRAVEDLDVRISDEDVAAAVAAKLEMGGLDGPAVQRIAEKLDLLAEGLEAVIVQEADPDAVFAEKLRGRVEEEEWRVYVKLYATKERLAELRRMTPRSVNDVKRQSMASTRRDLARAEVQRQALIAMAQEAGDEASARAAREKTIAPHTGICPFTPEERVALAAWWAKRLQIAQITIETPAADDIMRRVRASFGIGNAPAR